MPRKSLSRGPPGSSAPAADVVVAKERLGDPVDNVGFLRCCKRSPVRGGSWQPCARSSTHTAGKMLEAKTIRRRTAAESAGGASRLLEKPRAIRGHMLSLRRNTPFSPPRIVSPPTQGAPRHEDFTSDTKEARGPGPRTGKNQKKAESKKVSSFVVRHYCYIHVNLRLKAQEFCQSKSLEYIKYKIG